MQCVAYFTGNFYYFGTGNPLVDGMQAMSTANILVKDDPDTHASKLEKFPDFSRSQSAPILSLTSADAEKKRNLLAEVLMTILLQRYA